MFGKKPCPCGCGEMLRGTRWKAMREYAENEMYLEALADRSVGPPTETPVEPADIPPISKEDGHAANVAVAGYDINDGLEAYGHYGESRALPSFTERTQFQAAASRIIGRKIKL